MSHEAVPSPLDAVPDKHVGMSFLVSIWLWSSDGRTDGTFSGLDSVMAKQVCLFAMVPRYLELPIV